MPAYMRLFYRVSREAQVHGVHKSGPAGSKLLGLSQHWLLRKARA
jgi:hypothetical protein